MTHKFRLMAFSIMIFHSVFIINIANTFALENIINSITDTVGAEKIPFSYFQIKKTASQTSLEWLYNEYSTNQGESVFFLPETISQIPDIEGFSAFAFKTWEHDNYVQNLIIDTGDNFFLFTTPHILDINENGLKVFIELFNIVLPESNLNSDLETERTLFQHADRSLSGQRASYNKGNFGTKVGSFNGVDAYSNGSVGYVSGLYNTTNGYNTGLKWQCVEFVNRYFKIKFGRNIRGGNANTYFSNASAKRLNSAPNGGTNGPQVGNIICSAGGGWGHVAIIREVGKDYLVVIHQNFNNSSADNYKKIPMKVTKRNGKTYYEVGNFSSGYPIQGWLWPK